MQPVFKQHGGSLHNDACSSNPTPPGTSPCWVARFALTQPTTHWLATRGPYGAPVLDDDDRTFGHVRSDVRTASGKVQLIVPYGGILGWRQRLVAVPIEVVAIAGRQLAALDMTSSGPSLSSPSSIGPDLS